MVDPRPTAVWDGTQWVPIVGNSNVTPHASTHSAGSTDPLQNLVITPTAANQKPLIVKGASGQTENLQEWQSSGGTVLASVTKDGYLTGVTPQAADNSTKAATTAWAAERAAVGNLLTANQASVETNTSGFFNYGSGGSLSVSSDYAIHGTKSLKMAYGGANGGIAGFSLASGFSNALPIYGGEVMTFAFSMRHGGAQRTLEMAIDYWNAAGTQLSSSYPLIPIGSVDTWNRYTHTVSAPSGAAYTKPSILSKNINPGDLTYFDCIGYWRGAGGDWAMPGVPITNLGIKVSRPNIDDYLCQQWSNTEGKWVTTRYDSGWRDVSGLLINGWATSTDPVFELRRLSGVVVLNASVTGAAKTSDVMANLPAGFRPRKRVTWVGNIGNNTTLVSGDVLSASSAGDVRGFGANGLQRFTATWLTDDAIPTSLPGTLISAAPA